MVLIRRIILVSDQEINTQQKEDAKESVDVMSIILSQFPKNVHGNL